MIVIINCLFENVFCLINNVCSGWSIISEPLKVIPGTVKTCSDILKENNLLAISPGGVYEAQFGDRYYRLMWKKRLGFAKVAIEAKVVSLWIFVLCNFEQINVTILNVKSLCHLSVRVFRCQKYIDIYCNMI